MKRFVRGLNQPMTARLIKTARSLKIPHEIGLILLCFASASAPLATSEGDDFIGQTLSHDVSREITKERTGDFRVRKRELFVCILM